MLTTLCALGLSHYQWSLHNQSPGPSVGAMDGFPGTCTATTLDPGGPSKALSITKLGPPLAGYFP